MSRLFDETTIVIEELIDVAKLNPHDIVVVGCSTSEVVGGVIGRNSDINTAMDIYEALMSSCASREIYLAVQCCEHLNRALVIENDAVEMYNLDIVNAVPQIHAGGALATVAYKNFHHPVLVESLRHCAKAGIDIGQTLIGMHIKPVVVPVRVSRGTIGEAIITCARYRPKYVGGERAEYNKHLL